MWWRRSTRRDEPVAPAQPAPPGPTVTSASVDTTALYKAVVAHLIDNNDYEKAMELAVGGNYEERGAAELAVLRDCGLRPDDYIVDVGCGSGRLAKRLASLPSIRYLGVDVIPELLEFATTAVSRPDFEFMLGDGRSIPEADGVADFICFFSVFTHLLHEHSYIYLQEARRVLRPGGRVLFTYFDFAVPDHWPVFEGVVEGLGQLHPLAVFLSKDAITTWAGHLGLVVDEIVERPTVLVDGESHVLEQAHAVLRKPV